MIKREELSNPNSCMSRAKDDEMTFVLLARDEAAPMTIRVWVGERVRLGKNKMDDPQIKEALRCADEMSFQRMARNRKPEAMCPTCRGHKFIQRMFIPDGTFWIRCPDCHGKGRVPEAVCPVCKGTRLVEVFDEQAWNYFRQTCHNCHGAGKQVKK
jgi:DnaJ-class molecular chaperone